MKGLIIDMLEHIPHTVVQHSELLIDMMVFKYTQISQQEINNESVEGEDEKSQIDEDEKITQ